MHSRDYYRHLNDEDFLVAMKGAPRITEEMAAALLERVEELIDQKFQQYDDEPPVY